MAHINDRDREETNKSEKRKEKKRKGIEAQRVKHPTPSWATGAFIGDEEENNKKKQGAGP